MYLTSGTVTCLHPMGTGKFPIGECLDAFTPTLDEFQTESKCYGNMILTDMDECL